MSIRGSRSVAALFVAVSVLAACSNSSDEAQSTKAPAESPAPTQAATPTEAPATQPAASTPAGSDPAASTPAETSAPTEPPTTQAAGPDLGEFKPITGVPGVDDKEIKFAVVGTGPANPLGYCQLDCYKNGIQAYFDYRNSLGGVHGRQLKIGRVDDDELGNNQVKALEVIEAKDSFGVFFSSCCLFTGIPDIGKSDMPAYTVFPAAPDANGEDNIFLPTGTGCLDCPRKVTVITAKLAGATKVASLGYGVSDASKACVANHVATFKKWGAAVGIELVYSNDTLPFGFTNGLGPEVTAMKEKGVDFILTCVDQNGIVTLEQELKRQGIGDVPTVLPQGYSDAPFLTANKDLLEGSVMSLAYRPFEAPNAETQLIQEWVTKGGYDFNDYVIQGWMNAELAVTGLLKAGPEFDRAKVISATNAITDHTGNGMFAPVDWTRQHNAPTPDDPSNGPKTDCVTFISIKGGAAELIGDKDKPFYCFDPTVAEWQEPTQMNW